MSNLDDLMYRTIWSDETTVRKQPLSKEIAEISHYDVRNIQYVLNERLCGSGSERLRYLQILLFSKQI